MNSPKTVDAYLTAAPKDARTSLEKVRRIIKATAPTATEGISYQIPAYKYRGKLLVGIGAFKNHCTFFVMGYVERLFPYAPELRKYERAKSGVIFPHTKPIPSALVKKIVKIRMADIDKQLQKRHREHRRL